MNNLKNVGMYVIRDTKTNNVMKGAKGQYLFDNEVSPKRSVAHTSWFPEWQRFEFLRSLGHDYEVDQYEEALDERKRLQRHTSEDTGYGSHIQNHVQNKYNVLWSIRLRYHSDVREAFIKNNSFAKQTRFVVEKVVHLVSEPIPKKGK